MEKVIEKKQRDFQKKENDSPKLRTKPRPDTTGKPKSVKVVKTVSSGPGGTVIGYTVTVYLGDIITLTELDLEFTSGQKLTLIDGSTSYDNSGIYNIFFNPIPTDTQIEIDSHCDDTSVDVTIKGGESKDVPLNYQVILFSS